MGGLKVALIAGAVVLVAELFRSGGTGGQGKFNIPFLGQLPCLVGYQSTAPLTVSTVTPLLGV